MSEPTEAEYHQEMDGWRKYDEAKELLARVRTCWADEVDRRRFLPHDLKLASDIDSFLAVDRLRGEEKSDV